jgi:two-component system OmpR family response regulator
MIPVSELAPALRRADGSAVRVLVVDDEPTLSELLAMALRYEGWEVRTAADGSSAVRTAREFRPDAVVLDVMLPDFDGFEVLRRLRAETSTAAIPCIALSANAMPEDIERGLAAGFADYWTKPIDFAAFLTALKKRFPASAVGVERQS